MGTKQFNEEHLHEQPIDREPVVAGRFYPSDPVELNSMLKEFFSTVKKIADGKVRAVIVPHAGYVFSGKVAASGIGQIPSKAVYDHIFVLASSHRVLFDGASIYNCGNYITPLGTIEVDFELTQKLIDENECFTFRSDAHIYEHSLEVQLPFLQHHLKKPFKLVPIVLGTQNAGTCKTIAEALKPYFNDQNLFVISSDFSHYPSYEDAQKIDLITANAIETGSTETFITTIRSWGEDEVPNLATCICGWTSVLTLMHLAETDDHLAFQKVMYRNSGDNALYGDKERVVGYYSLILQEKSNDFTLKEEEKKTLLDLARDTIEEYLQTGKMKEIDSQAFSGNLVKPLGAFVSLHIKDKLRGCIGRFQPVDPLYLVVQKMAVSAAVNDSRFAPVTLDELYDIDIEISVLSPLKRIYSDEEIILGKHGIYMVKEGRSGTFLPQVATKMNWTLDEYLGYCARNKANIGWEGWKDAELYTFEAQVFGESRE